MGKIIFSVRVTWKLDQDLYFKNKDSSLGVDFHVNIRPCPKTSFNKLSLIPGSTEMLYAV